MRVVQLVFVLIGTYQMTNIPRHHPHNYLPHFPLYEIK